MANIFPRNNYLEKKLTEYEEQLNEENRLKEQEEEELRSLNKRKKWNLYLLRLQDGRYYIGKSDISIQKLKKQIPRPNIEWTRRYLPLSIIDIRPLVRQFDEDFFVKECMKRYGIPFVRGGSYSDIMLSPNIIASLNLELKNQKDSPIIYSDDSDHENCIDYDEMDFVDDRRHDRCPRCHKTGHTIDVCYSLYDINGNYIEY